MVSLQYNGFQTDCRHGESSLDALLRVGAPIDFSCRAGVCRRCLLRAKEINDIPDKAIYRLPESLRKTGHILACQCYPKKNLTLLPPLTQGLQKQCSLLSVSKNAGNELVVSFEPHTEFQYNEGDIIQLFLESDAAQVILKLLAVQDNPWQIQGVVKSPVSQRVHWLNAPDESFGLNLFMRGPFPCELIEESISPPLNPRLWESLEERGGLRLILETFYDFIYADEVLGSYFQRISRDRIVGKQYAFFRQLITGEGCYIGERPRNAHSWMVIPDSAFNHRKSLMRKALGLHGVSDQVVVELEFYEEWYRADIVKCVPWGKIVGGNLIDTERILSETLSEATICDYCDSEIPAGSVVRYHARLGLVGCQLCSRKIKSPDHG